MKNITRHTADRMSATKRIGKGKAMMKIYCDRCGEEITGIPLKMLPTVCQNIPADKLDEMLLLKDPLRHKVFCKECIAEIADFALNKNTCDECVQQMMDENAMLREEDEDSSKYRKAIEKYGVSRKCGILPKPSGGQMHISLGICPPEGQDFTAYVGMVPGREEPGDADEADREGDDACGKQETVSAGIFS